MAWLAASLVATGADRGLAVKQPVEVGLGEYEPERCHALVVGISQYRFWPDLRCAASDAVSVASVLRSAYGFKDVRLLLDDQATRRGILEAIDSYTKLGEKDCLLIYYAGHGWMDENRNGFWVPQDAPKDDKFSYVSNSQIVNDYFKKYKVKHLLVMADSCFSGAMLRGGPDQTRPSNWELPAGFRKPSAGLRKGRHSIRVAGATGTWAKFVDIESGKTVDLIAEFPAVAAPVYAPPPDERKTHRPKAH
jgi:uncharacterized caspase-like protein